MSMMQEFRKFAMRGNVVDLAVGVVIGAAFGKIVSSLVADIIMPPLGLALAGLDFTKLGIVLREAQGEVPATVLAYGKFIQVCFDFMIIAFVIFLLVKGINRLKREEEAKPSEPPAPTAEEKLLTEIRDLLKNK